MKITHASLTYHRYVKVRLIKWDCYCSQRKTIFSVYLSHPYSRGIFSLFFSLLSTSNRSLPAFSFLLCYKISNHIFILLFVLNLNVFWIFLRLVFLNLNVKFSWAYSVTFRALTRITGFFNGESPYNITAFG